MRVPTTGDCKYYIFVYLQCAYIDVMAIFIRLEFRYQLLF